jgi:hypothetical protein
MVCISLFYVLSHIGFSVKNGNKTLSQWEKYAQIFAKLIILLEVGSDFWNCFLA